jgi:hypothetical protein
VYIEIKVKLYIVFVQNVQDNFCLLLFIILIQNDNHDLGRDYLREPQAVLQSVYKNLNSYGQDCPIVGGVIPVFTNQFWDGFLGNSFVFGGKMAPGQGFL